MAFDPKTAKPVGGFDIKSAKPVSPTPKEERWKLGSFASGLSQSSTLNFGDEIQGFLRAFALVEPVPSTVKIPGTDIYLPKGVRFNQDFGEVKKLIEQGRALNKEYEEDNPLTNVAGRFAGAIPQGLSVLRGAAAAGPKLGAQTLGAAKTGAKIAVPSAVGNIDVSDPDWLEKAAIETAIQTGAAAATPGLDRVIRPVAKYAKDKMFPGKTMDDTAEALREGIPAKVPGKPGITDIVSGSVSLPATGAVAGVTAREFGPQEISGDKIPWSPDPLSAAADRALYGGFGALAGLGLRTSINLGKDALIKGGAAIDKGASRVSSEGERMITDVPTGRFQQLDEWLHGIQRPKGPGATGAPTAPPTVAPDAPSVDKRKAAMAEQTTPEGRARTNPESPAAEFSDDLIKKYESLREPTLDNWPARNRSVEKRNESLDELDEFFRNIPSQKGNNPPTVREPEGSYSSMTPEEQAAGDAMWQRLAKPDFFKMSQILKDEKRKQLGSISNMEKLFGPGKVNEGSIKWEDEFLRKYGWTREEYYNMLTDKFK